MARHRVEFLAGDKVAIRQPAVQQAFHRGFPLPCARLAPRPWHWSSVATCSSRNLLRLLHGDVLYKRFCLICDQSGPKRKVDFPLPGAPDSSQPLSGQVSCFRLLPLLFPDLRPEIFLDRYRHLHLCAALVCAGVYRRFPAGLCGIHAMRADDAARAAPSPISMAPNGTGPMPRPPMVRKVADWVDCHGVILGG